jgi:hypothetical protein
VLESEEDVHQKVANQSNSELLSLSPTRSAGPPRIQIDVQIAYDLHFGCSTYAIVLRNQGEDHGGQMGHQEGAGERRRHAPEGGEPIQFGIAEFESNLECRITWHSN